MTRMKTALMVMVGALAAAVPLLLWQPRPAVATAETPPTPPLKVGFVSMQEFQKNSVRWKSQAAAMSARRMEASKKLMVHQDEFRLLQSKLVLTTDANQKADLEASIKDKQQEMEGRTKRLQQEIERESLAVLRGFKETFEREVKALARERALHAVLSYPASESHGMTAEEAKSSIAMDLYFRPSAMMPVFLDDALDVTRAMIQRFDAGFEAADDK